MTTGDPVQTPADQLPDTATPALAVSTVGGFIEKVLQIESGNTRRCSTEGTLNAGKVQAEPSLSERMSMGNYLLLDYEHTLYSRVLVSQLHDFTATTTPRSAGANAHYSLPTRTARYHF